MEKEKKGIKCSYAVLVIILFAALAFVTDYAVIDRKVNKCNCPDCKLSGNANVVNDGSIITNSDGSTTEQKKVYTYNDLAGLYTVDVKSTDGGDGNVHYKLYLNADGTFIYDASYHAGFTYMGNYTIENNKITLNFIFKGWHEPFFSTFYHTSIVNIISDSELVDTNVVDYSDSIGTKEITLIRSVDDQLTENYKSKFKENLDSAELINNYTKNN